MMMKFDLETNKTEKNVSSVSFLVLFHDCYFKLKRYKTP